MTFHQLNNDRLLVLVSQAAVADVLAGQVGRPIVALLTSHDVRDVVELESVIQCLLGAGCEYFVCFGPASEALHDRVDDLRGDEPDDILTTWHEDESAAEVAEWFLNTAGATPRTLLIGVLDERDADLSGVIVELASS